MVADFQLLIAEVIIKGDGKVENVNVNANDTVVTVKDAKINTKKTLHHQKQMKMEVTTSLQQIHREVEHLQVEIQVEEHPEGRQMILMFLMSL